MSELFRLTVLRPSQTPEYGATISLATELPFQQELKAAESLPLAERRAFYSTRALAYLGAGGPPLVTSKLVGAVGAVLTHLEQEIPPDLDAAGLLQRFTDARGGPPVLPEIDAMALSDWLVAHTLAGKPPAERAAYERLRRGYFLLTESVALRPSLSPASVARALRAWLALPAYLAAVPMRFGGPRPHDGTADTREAELRHAIETRREQLAVIEGALGILTGLRGDLLYKDSSHEDRRAADRVFVKPEYAKQPPPLLAEALQLVGLDLNQAPYVVALTEIENKRVSVLGDIARLGRQLPAAAPDMAYPVGNLWWKGTAPGVTYPGPLSPPPPPPAPSPPALPQTYGKNLQHGIGDLFVVRHVLKGYRRGEISHIENVLKSETRSRDHRRLERREQSTTDETETTTTDERSLETTSRHELQIETASSLKEEHQLKAGVGLSAKFGEMVQLKTNVDYSYDRAQEDSVKAATRSSTEVVEKAVKKLEERVRREQVTKVLIETEEQNLHAFDNRAGEGHISGVYQWIDKLYDVQVWNHGVHDMFDLVIPEPAAFLFHAFAQQVAVDDTIHEPVPLTQTAREIDDGNYLELAATYGATGIKPPPPVLVTQGIGLAIESNPDKDAQSPLAKANRELVVPSGYIAYQVLVAGRATTTSDTPGSVYVYVGEQSALVHDSNDVFMPQPFSTDVPIAMIGDGIKAAAVTVTVVCLRTPEAMRQWQIETHQVIAAAYEKRLGEYRDAITAAMLRDGAAGGTNPEDNRRVMEAELRKHCLALITDQQFESFGAIRNTAGPAPYPQLDLPKANVQAPYIRFFEAAFEWENLSYFFYPYFWGGDEAWAKKVKLTDTDPRFAEFLRAGAARVIVPVRKGYETEVAAFLAGGQPWAQPSSAITSNPSADVLAEIEAAENPTLGGTLVRRWEVSLPTSLVKLRAGDDLPTYVESPPGSGAWKQVDEPADAP